MTYRPPKYRRSPLTNTTPAYHEPTVSGERRPYVDQPMTSQPPYADLERHVPEEDGAVAEERLRRALERLRDHGYQPMYNGRPSCPFCSSFVDAEETHAEGCVLVAALDSRTSEGYWERAYWDVVPRLATALAHGRPSRFARWRRRLARWLGRERL
jgi:hypothetical protein